MNNIHKGLFKIMLVGMTMPSFLWSCSRMNTNMEQGNPNAEQMPDLIKSSPTTSNTASTSIPLPPIQVWTEKRELSDELKLARCVQSIVNELRSIIGKDTLSENNTLKQIRYYGTLGGPVLMAIAEIATMAMYSGIYPPPTDRDIDECMKFYYSRCMTQEVLGENNTYINYGEVYPENTRKNPFWVCEHIHKTILKTISDQEIYLLSNHPAMTAIGLVGLAGLVCTVGGGIGCTLLLWAKSGWRQLRVSSEERTRKEKIANAFKELEELHQITVKAYLEAKGSTAPNDVAHARFLLNNLFNTIKDIVDTIKRDKYNYALGSLGRKLSALNNGVCTSLYACQQAGGRGWPALERCNVAIKDVLN